MKDEWMMNERWIEWMMNERWMNDEWKMMNDEFLLYDEWAT